MRIEKKELKQMFLSLFTQKSKAKIANNASYYDTIVIQITKKLDVTEKKTKNIFEISALKLAKNS